MLSPDLLSLEGSSSVPDMNTKITLTNRNKHKLYDSAMIVRLWAQDTEQAFGYDSSNEIDADEMIRRLNVMVTTIKRIDQNIKARRREALAKTKKEAAQS